MGARIIPHTASTDHRILRGGMEYLSDNARPARGAGLPVMSFYSTPKGVETGEDERDRAVGLVKLALMGDASASRVFGHALSALDSALLRIRRSRCREAKGNVLGCRAGGRRLWPCSRPFSRRPGSRAVTPGAAWVSETNLQAEMAEGYWRSSGEVKPLAAGLSASFSSAACQTRAWDKRTGVPAWLRLDPLSAEATPLGSRVCWQPARRPKLGRVQRD